MKVLLMVVLAALAVSCSGEPGIQHKSKTPAEARMDYDDCHAQAAMAAALAPASKYEAAREKALDECMKSKGYEVK